MVFVISFLGLLDLLRVDKAWLMGLLSGCTVVYHVDVESEMRCVNLETWRGCYWEQKETDTNT